MEKSHFGNKPINYNNTEPRHTYTPLWSRGDILTSHAADPGSIPGRVNFLVEVFPGFSLNHKTNVRKFGPNSSSVNIWPSYNIQTI